MKRLVLAFALVLVLGSAAAARAEEDGAALYASKCKSCHGPDGKGSPVGLKMGAKDLTVTKLTVPEIVAITENGRGKMPKAANLTPAQREAIAKYVKKGVK